MPGLPPRNWASSAFRASSDTTSTRLKLTSTGLPRPAYPSIASMCTPNVSLPPGIKSASCGRSKPQHSRKPATTATRPSSGNSQMSIPRGLTSMKRESSTNQGKALARPQAVTCSA
ncbi:hypothetical protein VTK56DRAFT_8045 [Thermocarpiscus australiensis]